MKYLLLLILPVLVFSPCRGQDRAADQGKRLVITEISISGNKKTKTALILRELSIREGQTIAADSLQELTEETRQRLATPGLFTEVGISHEVLSDTSIRWDINLKERWYVIPEPTFQLADRNFNVWWNEQGRDIRRTIIGVTVRHKNFRGRMEQLIATVQVGYTKRFGLEYFKPYVDKRHRHGLGVSFAVAESQETFYATDSNKLRFISSPNRYILRQYEGALLYSYRPAYASRHLLRLGFRHYQIDDTIARLNREYYTKGAQDLQMLELAYRYERNETDNWNYPLLGTKMIGQLVTRLGLKGFSHQAFATLELGKYYRLGGNWYASGIFRGRLSLPEEQPYALRAALGSKYDYVRGYEYYVIDGSHFGVLRLNLKYELLNLTLRNIPLRYLPALPLRIYPKIFADAGYVRNQYPGNSFLNNRMLSAYGAGLDVFTAYDIKIRLEYTWNHLGQNDLFLHFNSE